MSRVVGVLLAAGGGVRAGGPKALRRDPGGTPWVCRAVDVLVDGGCPEVVVVTGAASDAVAAEVNGRPWTARVDTIDCRDWADGMGSSLRAGLEAPAVSRSDVAVVHLVDLPDVPAESVRRLLDRGRSSRHALLRAGYHGRPGHPVLIGAGHVAALLLTLEGDEGARSYLREHDVGLVECGDLASGLDVDGPGVTATDAS